MIATFKTKTPQRHGIAVSLLFFLLVLMQGDISATYKGMFYEGEIMR